LLGIGIQQYIGGGSLGGLHAGDLDF
jgi:hypothetical protein